jgi:hypothetical protein
MTRPKPVRGSTPTDTGRAPKRPRNSSGPEVYKEALTNIKIAIFREICPEDKLTEDDQNCILEVLGRMLRGAPMGELPHMKSYRLEGGADQESGQRLVRVIDNHRLELGARLKATDAWNLPKPVNVALRTRDKVAQIQDELL